MYCQYCPECGAKLQPTDTFCGECGAPQEVQPPSAASKKEEGTRGAGNGNMPQGNRPTSAPSVQLEPNTLLLDRYIIVKRVGGGGMGSVYQARDRRLADRHCAVKEMIEMFADEHQRAKAVEDFKREAEVLAQLEHPSIPTIYDYFIESGRYYLVMKWIGGGDLADQMRLRGGTVDEATVTKWAIQICDVLHFIHSQKPPIIYRDLKPANLMLDDKTGRVMLVDFGIARIVRPTEKGVTAIGTMGYAPPELFAGKVEPRSDIYSLGATMFHMMTGSDPQDNPLLIFDFAKNPRPSQINPAISPGMERILMKAVAHRPEDRHLSALDLMRSLEEHTSRLQGVKSSSSPSNFISRSNPGLSESRPVPPSVVEQVPPSVSRTITPPEQPAPEWVFCGHCGQQIQADDVFCPQCGTRQPLVGQQQGVYSPYTPGGYSGQGRATAELVVLGKPDSAKHFRIEKDSVLIGRQDPHTGIFPEVDLTSHDPDTKVSRRHARITKIGEQYTIEDLQSVNGTTVINTAGGQKRLNPGVPQVLTAGDQVKLGETVLKFVIV